MRISELQQIYLEDAKKWRKWLKLNHEKSPGIWLIYFKKHSGKPRVPYNEAVEEALCFGWIDSTVKRIDEDRYMQVFTPRNPKSNWSELNKKRVEELISHGKMTDAGMKAINIAKKNGKWDEIIESQKNYDLSADFVKLFETNEKAFAVYNKLAPSHRKQYINWVMSAKKSETRLKRCREMIGMLEQDQKPGMK